MRDKYALYVDKNEIIATLFYTYLADHDIDRYNKKQLRMALVSMLAEIQNFLIDDYDLDDDIEEEV